MWKFEGSEPYVVDLVRWHVFQETSQSESKAEALSRKRKKAKQSKQATVAWDHRKYYWCAKQKSEISSWTCVRTFIEPKYTIRTSVLTWSISIPYFTGQHIFQRISQFKAGNRWLGPVKNIKISPLQKVYHKPPTSNSCPHLGSSQDNRRATKRENCTIWMLQHQKKEVCSL